MPDPDRLHGLLSAALEDLNFLETHFELLEIAIEQLESSDTKLDLRVSLLVNLFLSYAQSHHGELKILLNRAIEVSSNG